MFFLFFSQFDNLKIPKDSFIDGKAHKSTHFMKPMYTRCTRIDMQGIDSRVVHHFKDM